MAKNTIKKAVPMVIGGLIISLVVSALPTDLLGEASRGLRRPNVNEDVVTTTATKTYLTLEEAEAIALSKINHESAKITDFEIELGYYDPHYTIWVTTYHTEENKIFKIKINGITGDIKDVDVEVEKLINEKIEEEKKDKDKEEKIKEKGEKVKTNNGRFISKYEAKMIALDKVNNKTAYIRGFEIELEKDIPHYLIGVKTTTHKYLMKINAETSEIFDLKTEVRDTDDDDDDDDDKDNKIRGNSDKIDKDKKNKDKNKDKKNKDKNLPVVNVKYITKEAAFKIALDRIGKSATLDEIEFEKDDNPPKYEIEMYDDKYEYEFEIHAITGAILEYERDED